MNRYDSGMAAYVKAAHTATKIKQIIAQVAAAE
jgi:hypothetical protein